MFKKSLEPDTIALDPKKQVKGAPQTDLARKLEAYWVNLKGENPFPSRKLVQPREIPVPLSQIFIIRKVPTEKGLDFLHAIYGTSMAKGLGIDPQGQLLSQSSFSDEAKKAWHFIYSAIIHTAQPLHLVFPFPEISGVEGEATASLFPLGDDKEPDHILGMADTMPGELRPEQIVGNLVQRI